MPAFADNLTCLHVLMMHAAAAETGTTDSPHTPTNRRKYASAETPEHRARLFFFNCWHYGFRRHRSIFRNWGAMNSVVGPVASLTRARMHGYTDEVISTSCFSFTVLNSDRLIYGIALKLRAYLTNSEAKAQVLPFLMISVIDRTSSLLISIRLDPSGVSLRIATSGFPYARDSPSIFKSKK